MTSPYAPPPNESLIREHQVGIHTDAYGNPLPQLLSQPRSCKAGRGMSWLTQAFNMFKDEFLLWIGITVAFLGIFLISGFIPIIGSLIGFATLIFIGGIMVGCAAQAQGDELKFEHLFAGFKTHFVPLLILSLLYMVAIIIAMIPVFVIIGTMVFSLMAGDVTAMDQVMSDGSIMALVLAYLVAMALFIPVIMAVWFAPTLIVLHDVSPIDAMKMSFKGCLKNIVPMLVYGLVAMIGAVIAVVFTLGLGLIAVMPILMITYYTSYRDVWTDQPLSNR